MKSVYENCRLCARACSVDRTRGELGFCKSDSKMKISRAALHMWEEPIISGNTGSGAIFFSGCSLGCIFCQNSEISRGGHGVTVTESELADIMLRLRDKGAHNINLVTPTHFVPSVKESVRLAREKGLSIPIVYNTGSFDTPETIRSLSETADIFLPDLKYYLSKTAGKYSLAEGYPEAAKAAIAEMVRLAGEPVIENGLMKKGVIVRILLLPSHVAEAKLSLNYLFGTYGDKIYISLMNQYTPMPNMPQPLGRRVTHAEYEDLCGYAVKLGVKNCFIQDFGTAEESFIPPFDLTGVR